MLYGISLFTEVEVAGYFMFKNEAKKVLEKEMYFEVDKKLDIIGLLDSYGVPYSPNVQKSFFNIVCEDLNNSGHLNSSLDLYNLYINKTWQLNGLYKNNVTIGDFKKMQNFSLDFVKRKYPDMVKEGARYETLEEYENVSIYDYTASLENPVILYSCAANDLFFYYGFSLESLNAQQIKNLFFYYNDAVRNLQENIECNIAMLLNCNERANIFVMGLYMPSHNFLLNRLGMLIIKKINKAIETICDKYDSVYYVDVSCVSFHVLKGDFHPDANGQKIIAYMITESINKNLKFQDSKIDLQNDTNNEDIIIDQNQVSDIARIINFFLSSTDLPLNDYVEYSVGIEKALWDNGYGSMDYRIIGEVKEYFLLEYSQYDNVLLEKAFDIVITERKILFGFNEKNYSRNPDNVSNDKLSLIDYY